MLGDVGAEGRWVGCGWEAGVWWGGWGEVSQERIGHGGWMGKGWLGRVGKVGWAGHTEEGGVWDWARVRGCTDIGLS